MNKKLQTNPKTSCQNSQEQLIVSLARQEQNRTIYDNDFDPFVELRMAWRASTMRHLFHILPGQRILEIGAGDGRFTQALIKTTRRECPITSAVFSPGHQEKISARMSAQDSPVLSVIYLVEFPGALKNERFDYIVCRHMLDNLTRNDFLTKVKTLLKPGGGMLLFEPNPWNPYFQLRRTVRRLLPIAWRRPSEPISLNRLQVFSVLSEIGFTHINALPYDFLYAPIPRFLFWPAQHLSLIMENCPYLRNFAGSIYIWARNAFPENYESPARNLCEHPQFWGKVSFVIPCHNEEMNIGPLIKSLNDFLSDYIYEVIIVDDNSQDKTAAVTQELAAQDPRIKLLKRNPPNGVGRALREGIHMAQGEYIMMMDCDFRDIIPEMRDLFDAMAQGADVAMGSRFSRESVLLNYPFTKIIANRAFHVLLNLILKKQLRDISNNLKIMKKEVAKKLDLQSPDFAANAETGLQPVLLGYQVKEVPISWFNRSLTMGLSSFKMLRTGPNYARLFLKILKKRNQWVKK